jgi:predicted nicotinamide N-methyase
MTLASLISPSLERRRRSLLHRIHQRYQTITQTCYFGPIELEFTRIADPDVVLDEVVAEEDRREKISGVRLQDPQHLPYWAQLWESAGGLAMAIAHSDLTGKTVLDLGCGMGMSGVTAAACGANVLLADLEAPALLFARLNALPYSDRIRTRQLNWQTDHLPERFDLLLGADIVYERKQWEFLERFWQEHLALGGEIMLAEPRRQSGDAFIPWITALNWKLAQSTVTSSVGDNKVIRIFRLTRG